jgi:hypothetical protein
MNVYWETIVYFDIMCWLLFIYDYLEINLIERLQKFKCFRIIRKVKSFEKSFIYALLRLY